MAFVKSSTIATLVAASLVACATNEDNSTRYGEELTLTETTSVSAILAEPDSYIGQRLLVEGTVVDVCEHRGCWLGVAGENDGEQLRVKVEDGVIVFPMTARGLHARVEGVMEKLELTMEQTLAQAEHQAEEHGEEFDPSEITEPRVIYQLRGVGAVIGDVE